MERVRKQDVEHHRPGARRPPGRRGRGDPAGQARGPPAATHRSGARRAQQPGANASQPVAPAGRGGALPRRQGRRARQGPSRGEPPPAAAVPASRPLRPRWRRSASQSSGSSGGERRWRRRHNPAIATGSGPVSSAGFAFPLPKSAASPPSTWSPDQGVDISAPGNTPEYAVCSGTIVLHGIGGFGPWAPVLHCDGSLDGYSYVYYGHAGPARPAARSAPTSAPARS